MPFESAIPSSMLQAYVETDFHVKDEPPFILHIGQTSIALRSLHKRHQVRCSAFITAFNPFSRSLDLLENQVRQQELAQALSQRSLVFCHGEGRHPSNQWPGEGSFLILGLPLMAAKVLGERFEQNAIVWSDADAVPQLVLLR